MGDNLKVVSAEFSTLSQPVFVMSVMAWHTQEPPCLEFKTRPVSLCRESLLNGNQLRSAALNTEIIIFLFYKTSYLNKEVNCTTVRVPWLMLFHVDCDHTCLGYIG